MGRYRPPQPPSSPYITAEGHRELKQELNHLWRVERPAVTQALAAAAAEGDRSENAEYIYRKKQLGGIDRRIRYLSKRMDVLKVIHDRPRDIGAVYFGAHVEIEDEAGNLKRFRIVGSDEIDPKKGYISIDSPMARALLKKRVDDEVDVASTSLVPARWRVHWRGCGPRLKCSRWVRS
jgi:transcription elongation factor GreB